MQLQWLEKKLAKLCSAMCLKPRLYNDRVASRNMRPRVNDNLFDGSQRRGLQSYGFISRSRLSRAST